MQRSGRSLRPVLLLLCALGFSAGTARAHQRDMVNADLALAVRLGEGFIDLTLHLQYKEFPSLVERRAMDADRDGWIGPQEAAAYVQEKSGRLLEAVRLTVAGRPVGLQVLGEPTLEFFGSARVVPLHQDLTVELSSPLELPGPDNSLLFRLNNRLEWPYPGRIVFALSAERSLQVDSTSLDDVGQSLSRENLRSLWFGCRQRSGREVEQAIADGEDLWRLITYVQADNRPRIAVARLDTPATREIPAAGPESSAKKTRGHEKLRDLVLGYLKGEGDGVLPLWLLLAAAFLYGCIHALAPGHAKTVTAAYLVGSRGTYSQALLLALTVTLTHTGSILALAVATKLLYGQAVDSTGQAVLSGISGLIVMVFGIQRLRGGAVHSHGREGHDHGHPGRGHVHEQCQEPENKKTRSRLEVLWLGFAGGLMPCPGALWIYLLALGFGRPGLGVALILALSLGLALVLVAVGVVSIGLRNLIKVEQAGPPGRLRAAGQALGRLLPGLTGTLLVLLGSFLLWRSLADLGWIG